MAQEKSNASFAGRFAELRNECGLSVIKLAQALGVHRSYIYKLERSEADNPSPEFLSRLHEVTGINPEWLFGRGQKYAEQSSPDVSPWEASVLGRLEFRTFDPSIVSMLESLPALFPKEPSGVRSGESTQVPFVVRKKAKGRNAPTQFIVIPSLGFVETLVRIIESKQPGSVILKAVKRGPSGEILRDKLDPLVVIVLLTHALKLAFDDDQLARDTAEKISWTFQNPVPDNEE